MTDIDRLNGISKPKKQTKFDDRQNLMSTTNGIS